MQTNQTNIHLYMPKQQNKPSHNHNPSLTKIIQLTLLFILIAIVITYKINNTNNSNIQTNQQNISIKYALIGDIGGTNIRYQLVSFINHQKLPLSIIKQQRLKVENYETFEQSITSFLNNTQKKYYPHVIVIAIAGPIHQNTVSMPNIPKWGQLNGTLLAQKYNLSQFLLINDFEAASYGLLIVEQYDLISLNNHSIQPNKIRGVIGPGTGLGHSIIFNNKFVEDGITVLPSEAGHSDLYFIDEQTAQYIEFLKKRLDLNYIDVQKAFCGPSIPFMYEFYSVKLNLTQSFQSQTSADIVQQCLRDNPTQIYSRILNLFVKFYSSAIANFMIQHMTTGGVYLVGSLTKAFLPKIKQIDMLRDWKMRHPDMKSLVDKIPLIFCNEIDLGLKGAFVVAKRLGKSIKQQSGQKLVQDIF